MPGPSLARAAAHVRTSLHGVRPPLAPPPESERKLNMLDRVARNLREAA
jgi:hypothetical protein